MLVFVWRLLETLGYIEYKQEWDKESWSRSLGSLRSTLTLHLWMKMNMREKDSKRHSHSDPEGAPGLQGERTPRRQGPNQALLCQGLGLSCPEGETPQTQKSLGGVTGFET